MTEMSSRFPFVVNVLPVNQPIGRFYVAVLPVWLLLDTCYAARATAKRFADRSGYYIENGQRFEKEGRLSQIAKYIDGIESAFPNSIILAPNFVQASGLQLEPDEGHSDSNNRWEIEEDESGARLTIPSRSKLAPIIDGQHRLFAFTKSKPALSESTELICAVFLDLPKPFQAALFATINSTQKPVDRSLTYELFGYNIDKETPAAWGPDKVAVFLSRKLNTEDDSPFLMHVLVAAENDFALSRREARTRQTWVISMATIVQGIVRLISTNPTEDNSELQKAEEARRTRDLLRARKDASPLRTLYLEANDVVLHKIVSNYFTAVDRIVWSKYRFDAYDKKTVAVQAFFDVLRLVAPNAVRDRDVSVDYFANVLSGASRIDFEAKAFGNFSGAGRKFIRDVIQTSCGLELNRPLTAEEHREISSVISDR